MHYSTLEESVTCIKSGYRVFIQGGVMTPHKLINAMVARADELNNVEIVHIHIEGKVLYISPQYSKSFKTNDFFIDSNTRKDIHTGKTDYVPVFLSEVPILYSYYNYKNRVL